MSYFVNSTPESILL